MICLRKYLDRSQQFQDWILILSNSIINTIGFIQVRKMIKKLIYIIMYLLAYFQLPFVLTISHSILLYYFTYCSLYYIDEKIMGLVNTGKFHFIAILTINLYQHIFITLYSFLSYYLCHLYLIAANISIFYALSFINISSETIITLMHHHHDKFNISKQYLSEKIFIPEPPQQGQLWPNLNITVLPDYLAYIKHELSAEQRMLLSDYKLQTFLLQTALKAHPKNDFDICTNQIITHIRSHPQFWVKKIGAEQQSQKMHQAIQEYHQDCKVIDAHKITDKYPERQYKIPTWTKIQDDYIYFGSDITKGAHRFSAILYMHIANYLMKLKICEVPQHQFKQFVLQFTVNLAIKSKPKYRQFSSTNWNESPENLSSAIEQQLKYFTSYLQQLSIDTRCLSTGKDYFIISNSLYICKSYLLAKKEEKQTNNNIMICQSERIIENKDRIYQDKLESVFEDLVNRFVHANQLKDIIQFLLDKGYKTFIEVFSIRDQQEQRTKDPWVGMCNFSQMQLEQAFQSYGEIVNHPQNINKMKYKVEGSEVSWSDELYLKFLQKYLQFYHLPTNNKKIAIAMGKDIQSNHVKHVKGIYTRNMAVRISNGEIGGGRKGTFESKTEFISKDIQNFNMKWFKKQEKGRSKKIKRRKRRRQIFADEEHDSDY